MGDGFEERGEFLDFGVEGEGFVGEEFAGFEIDVAEVADGDPVEIGGFFDEGDGGLDGAAVAGGVAVVNVAEVEDFDC